MGVQFPQKSKAPAFVQPAGGSHPQQAVSQHVPVAHVNPLVTAQGSPSNTDGSEYATSFILEPTRH